VLVTDVTFPLDVVRAVVVVVQQIEAIRVDLSHFGLKCIKTEVSPGEVSLFFSADPHADVPLGPIDITPKLELGGHINPFDGSVGASATLRF
jgi:hypothetical protein